MCVRRMESTSREDEEEMEIGVDFEDLLSDDDDEKKSLYLLTQ